MLANFFDKTKPINSIVLTILFFSFYLIYSFQKKTTDFIDFTTFNSLLYAISSAFFLFVCGLVFIKNGVSNKNLYNSFLLILLYGLFPNTFDVQKTLGVVFLYLLIYKNISQLNGNKNTQLLLFNSGLLAGSSFLIFDWSLLFFVFIYIGLFYSKKATIINIISPIFGLITPVILFFTYCFITDKLPFFFHRFDFSYSLDTSFYNSLLIKIPLIVISIITSISIIFVFPKIFSVSNPFRFQYLLILVMLFIGGMLIFISPNKNGSEFLYVFIPIAVILGRFLKNIFEKTVKEVFLVVLALFSIITLFSHS